MIPGMNRLAINLRAGRGRCGLSQGQLARRADIHVGLVQRIEAGTVGKPHATTVARLADALQTTIEALEGHEKLESTVEQLPDDSLG